MNVNSRPSIAPSLATVASAEEGEEEVAARDEGMQENKKQEPVPNINDKKEIAVQENNKQISIRKCITCHFH